MTAPLGGKRRERKRLVRCGHRGLHLQYCADIDDSVRADCPHCLGVAVVDRAELDGRTPVTPIVLERLSNRIARKVTDG